MEKDPSHGVGVSAFARRLTSHSISEHAVARGAGDIPLHKNNIMITIIIVVIIIIIVININKYVYI